MKKIQTLIAGGIVVAGLAVAGGVAVANSSAKDSSDRKSSGHLTAEVVESMKHRNEPLPVMNPATGVGSGGTVLDAQFREQDDRVDRRLAELGITGEDARWDEAARALLVLEAAPVVDEKGAVIGYFGTQFIPAEDYEAATSVAQEAIDRLSE